MGKAVWILVGKRKEKEVLLSELREVVFWMVGVMIYVCTLDDCERV